MSSIVTGQIEFPRRAVAQQCVAAELRHPCRKRLPSSLNAGSGYIVFWLANVFRSDPGRRRPQNPLHDPREMQSITLSSAETNCDFDYGEGWITFRWITPDGFDASLTIDLDGHCSREMPIRSGSGPGIVSVTPDRLALHFHPALAQKLELDPDVELLFDFSDTVCRDLRRLADVL